MINVINIKVNQLKSMFIVLSFQSSLFRRLFRLDHPRPCLSPGSLLPQWASPLTHLLAPLHQRPTDSVFLALATHWVHYMFLTTWKQRFSSLSVHQNHLGAFKTTDPRALPQTFIQTKGGNVPRLSPKNWLLHVLLPLPCLKRRYSPLPLYPATLPRNSLSLCGPKGQISTKDLYISPQLRVSFNLLTI